MAKREYLDSAGLKQVLSALGDRIEDIDGIPKFYFPEKKIDAVEESTVVVPKRVVWDEDAENFCALSELGIYFRQWPGMEKWVNPRTGAPYFDKLYLAPGDSKGHGLYAFVGSSQPQRLALASDVLEAIDVLDGFPQFFFAEETSGSGEISPVAEETVVEPDIVVWDSVTEHFYGLSQEGVYFRKWPGSERWNDPELANGNSSYADKLYLNRGIKYRGLYSFAFSSVMPDRVWSPEDTEGADGVSYWICPSVGAVAKSAQPTFRTTKISAKVYKSTGASVSEDRNGTLKIEALDINGSPHDNVMVDGILSGSEIVLNELYTSSNEIVAGLKRAKTNFFRFTFYDVMDEEVASCTIPVVMDGAKGKDGTDGKDGSSFSANLMVNTAERIEGTFDAEGDNMIIKRECAVHMVQGETYTISARTNASGFIGYYDQGAGVDGCFMLLCHSEHGYEAGWWETISAKEMATDGSTGHTFVWDKPTGDYYLRVNFYLAGTWYVEKVKIEKGEAARTQWTPAESEMNPSSKIAALEADLKTQSMVIQMLRDDVALLKSQIG